MGEAVKEFTVAEPFRRACLNMVAWSLSSAERRMLCSEFVKLDTNNTGKISLKNLKLALEAECEIDSKFSKLFREVDDLTEDDEICYSDFLGVVLQGRVHLHQSALWAAFDRFDVGHKGFLTKDGL